MSNVDSARSDGPLVGVLLAAGRGSRFDALGHNNKLLALVDGQAVAVQSAANLRAHVDHLIIVIKPNSSALRQAFSDLDVQISECTDAEQGMGHSLAHGIALAQRLFAPRAVLLALADMPYIRSDTLSRLAMRARPDTIASSAEPATSRIIAAPRFAGQRGHPVLFGNQHFDALMASRGDTGASQLLRSPDVQWLDVADVGVIRDIDRPSDLLDPQK